MRAWTVVLAFLLAGCAEAATVDPLDGIDPTQPLHGPQGVQLLGQHVESDFDARVVSADCERGDASAYTFNATTPGEAIPDSVLLGSPRSPGNASVFFIAAYLPGPDGLVMEKLLKGGREAEVFNSPGFNMGTWEPGLPEFFTVPLDDGIARVVIGCQGDGAVNYVIGSDDPPSRPHYLQPTIVPEFDLFAAAGSQAGGTIYIPPTSVPNMATQWTTLGAITGHHDDLLLGGARVGTTEIRWSSGAGWTTAACSHSGLEEHGSWSYDGRLHAAEREAGDLMAYSIATLGLSQSVLFGFIEVQHTEEGDEAGAITFIVEHQGSQDLSYTTSCQGLHLGATLEDLFGHPGATQWLPPEGFL